MGGFTKLSSTIVTSSIWAEPHATRIVWITMLAMADRDGFVPCSILGLAHVARVTMDECTAALTTLQEPDKHSRTTEFEGRRVQVVEGGFMLLNYERYRNERSQEERTEYLRIAKQRSRSRSNVNTRQHLSTPVNTRQQNEKTNVDTHGQSSMSTNAEAEAEAEEQKQSTHTQGPAEKVEKPFPEVNTPSWDEFWAFCQSLQCGLAAEWYARDKWLAAEAKHWSGNENWRAYALRARGWWEQDGKPMTAPASQKRNGGPNAAQRGPFLSELKTALEAKKSLREKIKRRGHEDAMGWHARSKDDADDYRTLCQEIGQLMERIANYCDEKPNTNNQTT